MKNLLTAILVVGLLLAPTATATFTPFVSRVSAATFTNNQLATGALSTTLTTTLYTVPSSTTTIVMSLSVCNTNTTTTRNITIKAGGSTKRAWLSAFPLAANQTLVLQLNHVLKIATSDTIQGGQDTGTDVDYFISGVEIT